MSWSEFTLANEITLLCPGTRGFRVLSVICTSPCAFAIQAAVVTFSVVYANYVSSDKEISVRNFI